MKIIDIEAQKRKLLEEVRMQSPGYHALKKLRIIRENIDWAVEGYRNSLSILSDTTYEDRKHFLLELIQNADDADYGDNTPEITFSVTSEGLELYYNEVGFSVDDIISITDTGSSTKKSKKNSSTSFIGEKGIGFKSVFALAESVEIQSGHWHFLLEKEKCIVPLPISGNRKLLTGTKQKIRFINPNVSNEIYDELKRYVSGEVESFLYLQKMSKFTLIDKRNTKHEKHIIEILPSDRRGDRLTLRTVKTGEEREFLLYSENIVFPKELVASRWEKIGTSMGSVERKVILAAMLNSGVKDQSGRLFCYLPTSVKLPIPVFLQVDGMTKADRERLHDPHSNEWNRYLLSKLPDIIAKAIVSWAKKMDSPDLFHSFIPITEGEDQLYHVFRETIKLLKGYKWVKVMGDEPSWEKPEYVVRVPAYVNKLIKSYPDLRISIEKSLIRGILEYDWSENSNITDKLANYGVEMVSPLRLLDALISSGLPSEILKNNETLHELYNFMLDMLDFKFSKFSNPNDHLISKVTLFIRELKIFPIKNEGFSRIGDEENIYFITSEAANVDRLSDSIRLVDPIFTIDTKKSEDISKSNYTSMSETLCTLLAKLGVKELSKGNLLADFIVPELKSTYPYSYEERFEKFFTLFSHYDEMRRQNKDISKFMNEASGIWLFDDNKKLHKINEMLIPKSVRLTENENIYDSLGLKEIYINTVYMNMIHDNKKMFHDFLIDIGIKHKPQFFKIQEIHNNAIDFREEDNGRFLQWRISTKKDYTLHNKIIVDRVMLDQVDLDIIIQRKVTPEFERQLYNDWRNKYEDTEINEQTYYFKGKAIPGYSTVTYKRREKRCVQLEDVNWAGVEPELIPVKTYSGTLLPSSNVFLIPPVKNRQIQYLLEYIPVVLAGDNKFIETAYSSEYLKSLKIKDMNIKQIESLWSKVDASRYRDILSLIIELIEHNLSFAELKVFDRDNGFLRPVTDFRLGQLSNENAPLIETQYGNLGTLLGSICGLSKDGTIESYKNTLREVLHSEAMEVSIIRRFLSLLQEWPSYSNEDKIQIIDEFKSGVGEKKAPILIFENTKLYKELRKNGIWGILLPEDISSLDFDVLSKAATEIGFILPDSIGELIITKQVMHNNDESERCKLILDSYIEFLEDKEISRLNQKLKLFGGITQVFRHVSFANSISRRIKSGNIKYKLELPYLDDKDKRIILPPSLDSYEVVKSILILIEFAPRRNVERDMEYIKKTDEKKARDIKRGLETKEKSTTKPELSNPYGYSETLDQYFIEEPAGLSSDRSEKRIDQDLNSQDSKNSAEKPIEEFIVTDDIGQIIRNLEINLKSDNVTESDVLKAWNLGPNPDEEDLIRKTLVGDISDSLNGGPEIYKRKLRNVLRPQRTYKGVVLHESDTLIDVDSVDPKSFLEAEYDCRCQICSKQLVFKSGRKWISVYHIQERKSGAWFYDRPFNFLGLCPDCYTIARYGGTKDFSNLIIEARNVIIGDTFAEPVPEFNGDYYLVDVQLDNQNYKMKLSKIHMSYFAALIQANE